MNNPATEQSFPLRPETSIDKAVFRAALVLLGGAILALLALLLIILFPFSFGLQNHESSPLGVSFAYVLFARYSSHLILLLVTLFSGYIGYRLLVASGVRARVVIPREDYDLLAPLIQEGKAEAIDQYVRLSSLTGFTGAFTKLGVSGLTLATIGLTLCFSVFALFQSDYLDLVKLTLGAFIGSFVQGQNDSRTRSRNNIGNQKIG